MNTWLKRINRELKYYDRELYAVQINEAVQIYRKSVRWEYFEFEGMKFAYSRLNPWFTLSLTDNWRIDGKPVEWGIEPLMDRLRSMDQWRDDRTYDQLCSERERNEENRKRAYRNEVRARAYDMRRDFARATNDINTSTLEKIDNRRNNKWLS